MLSPGACSFSGAVTRRSAAGRGGARSSPRPAAARRGQTCPSQDPRPSCRTTPQAVRGCWCARACARCSCVCVCGGGGGAPCRVFACLMQHPGTPPTTASHAAPSLTATALFCCTRARPTRRCSGRGVGVGAQAPVQLGRGARGAGLQPGLRAGEWRGGVSVPALATAAWSAHLSHCCCHRLLALPAVPRRRQVFQAYEQRMPATAVLDMTAKNAVEPGVCWFVHVACV
jgi:hypothetical protein